MSSSFFLIALSRSSSCQSEREKCVIHIIKLMFSELEIYHLHQSLCWQDEDVSQYHGELMRLSLCFGEHLLRPLERVLKTVHLEQKSVLLERERPQLLHTVLIRLQSKHNLYMHLYGTLTK